jgi:hypothetical protein
MRPLFQGHLCYAFLPIGIEIYLKPKCFLSVCFIHNVIFISFNKSYAFFLWKKIDLYGVFTMADFEVIEIVDGRTPYQKLLGLDWAFDNQDIINLKTRKMTFESSKYRVIAPLDPSEGERFVEATYLVLKEINQLYRTITRKEDYVNPNAYGVFSWRGITLCASESDTGLENWQQQLQEVSTRRCARIDCAIRWVGLEIREPPSFHEINDLEKLLTKYEEEVLENHRLLSLDIALKETSARWCGAHKETI